MSIINRSFIKTLNPTISKGLKPLDKTSNTEETGKIGSLGKTVTGAASGDFALKDSYVLKLTPDQEQLLKTASSLRISTPVEERREFAKEEAVKNGHSYESNYIAATYTSFNGNMPIDKNIDESLAQSVKAGVVDAVSGYDKAQRQLDDAQSAKIRMNELNELLSKWENNPIKPAEYNSLKQELAQLQKEFPDVDKTIKEAEEKLKQAEQKLNDSQAKYKDVYGQNADLDIVRYVISTEFIPIDNIPSGLKKLG